MSNLLQWPKPVEPSAPADVLALQRARRPFTVALLTHSGRKNVTWCRLMCREAAEAEVKLLTDAGFVAVIEED